MTAQAVIDIFRQNMQSIYTDEQLYAMLRDCEETVYMALRTRKTVAVTAVGGKIDLPEDTAMPPLCTLMGANGQVDFTVRDRSIYCKDGQYLLSYLPAPPEISADTRLMGEWRYDDLYLYYLMMSCYLRSGSITDYNNFHVLVEDILTKMRRERYGAEVSDLKGGIL